MGLEHRVTSHKYAPQIGGLKDAHLNPIFNLLGQLLSARSLVVGIRAHLTPFRTVEPANRWDQT